MPTVGPAGSFIAPAFLRPGPPPFRPPSFCVFFFSFTKPNFRYPPPLPSTVKYEKIPIAVSRRLPLHPLFVARQRDNLDTRSTIQSFLEMETSPSAKSPRGVADFSHAVRDIRDICWGDIRTTGDDVWKRGDLVSGKRG